jgi:hypothetical protein
MSDILTLPEIRERLKDRRAYYVAHIIGCRPATIMAIRDGKTDNPSYRMVKALSDYLTRPYLP